MLQTLGSDFTYRTGDAAVRDEQSSFNLTYWLDILKRRFFYFLGIFGLVSISGLYVTAILKPLYLSEGKILLQSQEIAPDIISPVVTATASERAQLIQHRVMTRDNLLLIASKFGLFASVPNSSGIVDLMRKRTQIKPLPVEVDGQLRPNSRAVAFTVGFEYERPELALSVANELITLIVSGDESTRSNRTTEMIKLLTSQSKDIESQLESNQTKMLEIARRPPDTIPEMPEELRSQLSALATLKAELTQKSAVYSDAHPTVVALKKRIAMMERNLTQVSRSPVQPRSTPDDDIDSLKRQQQALEKQLADANGKLASARLREKLNLEQQESMQVIEAPSLPEKPVKSKKILMALIVLTVGGMLGIATAIGPEMLNRSIHSREQLAGVVDSTLIACVPFIATSADTVRMKLRILFASLGVLVVLVAIAGLVGAIVFNWPVDVLVQQATMISAAR